jgi:hypothetical protein
MSNGCVLWVCVWLHVQHSTRPVGRMSYCGPDYRVTRVRWWRAGWWVMGDGRWCVRAQRFWAETCVVTVV